MGASLGLAGLAGLMRHGPAAATTEPRRPQVGGRSGPVTSLPQNEDERLDPQPRQLGEPW